MPENNADNVISMPTLKELFDLRPEPARFCIRQRMRRQHETMAQAVRWWEDLLVRVRKAIDASEEEIAGHLRNVLESPER